MNTRIVLYNYLEKNKKTFLIIIAIFFIGMIFGIFFINHTNESEMLKIISYVNTLKENAKNLNNTERIVLLFTSLKQNIIFILIMWILGCSIIGSFLVYLAILYKGFSLGYTISSIIATMGAKCGSIFVFSSLLVQNIFLLPAIFVLAESGIEVYRRIIKRNVNIKYELIRHTIIMLIALVAICIASVLEVYVSTNLIKIGA